MIVKALYHIPYIQYTLKLRIVKYWHKFTGFCGSAAQTLIVAATGTYAVTVTDAYGCTATDTVNVTIYTVFQVTITENAGVLTSDATFENQWYDANGIILGATGQNYTPAINGDYYVIVTDVNGCTSTSNVISFIISVNSISSESLILVYPNP